MGLFDEDVWPLEALVDTLFAEVRRAADGLREVVDREEGRAVLDDVGAELAERLPPATIFLGEELRALEDYGHRLCSALPRSLAKHARVVVARGLLGALDATHGRRFAGRFQQRGRVVLGPGSVVPAGRPPWRSLITTGLSTDPANLGDLLWLDHFSPLPDGTLPCRVTVSYELEDVLDDLELAAADRFGVLLPAAAEELRLEAFGAGPREPGVVAARCERLLARHGRTLRFVVLPELVLDAAGRAAAATWQTTYGIPILVAGSVHEARAGRPRNVATTFAGRGARLEHVKFNAMEGEAIETAPAEITLYPFGDWSLLVLICKDLLLPSLDAVLRALRARIALVPALTAKTGQFGKNAEAHARDVQAVVAVANTPLRPTAAAALVARPLEQGALETIDPGSSNAPSLLVFSPFERGCEVLAD